METRRAGSEEGIVLSADGSDGIKVRPFACENPLDFHCDVCYTFREDPKGLRDP